MRLPNHLRVILFFVLVLTSTVFAKPTADLNPVGSATLKVLFWTIYDSFLYTSSGTYEGVEPGLALQIIYRRDISRSDLIDRTREEWRKLGLYETACEGWLSSLEDIWPDLKRGDELILQVSDNLDSNFYFNGELIGAVADRKFTESFLAIWLSEDSSYPKLRKQLIGFDRQLQESLSALGEQAKL